MIISKERITEVAINLFQERGYDNVTVQDICDACDITKPTFYNYVEAKESLILNIYDKVIRELLNNSYELIVLPTSLDQFYYIFHKLITDTTKYHADLISQLFVSNFKENKGSFMLRDPLTKLAKTILKQAQDKGEIHNTSDSESLYLSIAYMFNGYIITWCMTQGHFNLNEFYQRCNDILIVDQQYKDIYKKYES